jgi:hypothetical protein
LVCRQSELEHIPSVHAARLGTMYYALLN